MFIPTGDPLADFDKWDAEQQKKLERLPKCTKCHTPIQQDFAVCIDENFYCDECLTEMRVWVGDD